MFQEQARKLLLEIDRTEDAADAGPIQRKEAK